MLDFILSGIFSNAILQYILTPVTPLLQFLNKLISMELFPPRFAFGYTCFNGNPIPAGDGTLWVTVGVFVILLFLKLQLNFPKQLIPTLVFFYAVLLVTAFVCMLLMGPVPTYCH